MMKSRFTVAQIKKCLTLTQAIPTFITATSTQDRAAGFLQTVQPAPHLSVSQSFAENYTFQSGRAEMQRLLSISPAEAYFCGDDLLAVGALSAILDEGLKVPGDIGLIGLNDLEMARWQNIGLTTIRQPIDQIIAAAPDLVVATIAAPELPVAACILPCILIKRQTLRPVKT